MPWCPKCKNEYREGIKVCADCGIELVESLERTEGSPLIFGDQSQMEELGRFLAYNHLETVRVEKDEKEGVYELYIGDEERQKASMAVKIFLQQKAGKEKEALEAADGDTTESTAESTVGNAETPTYTGIYIDSAKQAEENRSSGYMLVVVGGIGLAAIGLILADILRLPAGLMNKYMICSVTGALFLLFFVMGILSIRSSRSLKVKAESESSLTSEIKNWCSDHLTAESLDKDLFPEGETGEEIKYFRRTDKMKAMISHQFLNLDEGFLDAFVDDYYPLIFEQEKGRK